MGGSWVIMLRPEVPADAPAGTVDYKLYCFGGEPRFLYVSQGLEDHATARISFATLGWEPLPFGRADYRPFDVLPPRPACLGEMAGLARELSDGILFVRVDFLVQGGRPRFSEMTLYPCGGFMPFDPPGWDGKLGKTLDLRGAYRP